MEFLTKRSRAVRDCFRSEAPSTVKPRGACGPSFAIQSAATTRPLSPTSLGAATNIEPSAIEGRNATLAFEKVDLQWININYTIKDGKKGCTSKKILTWQSGRARSGEILAIMGPSGSGKTSLLNALAGRILYAKEASLSGLVLTNGQPRNGSDFKRISAYVTQDDVLYAFLTVWETIWLSAQLHLPPTISHEEKKREVDTIIQELGLVKAQQTIIGNERTRGVSGGERRRVMIAVELISGPSIIFLDEPTSGLDSFQAQSVVSALKTLAEEGRTIVTVIHQPRSSIFQMFDRLHLLSDGRTIYFGETGPAVKYFEDIGWKCPPLWNAADFLLDLIATDYRSAKAEKDSKERVAALYQKNLEREQTCVCTPTQNLDAFVPAPLLHSGTTNRIESSFTSGVFGKSRKGSTWAQQFILLAWRSARDSLRNTEVIVAKFAISALLGILVGAMYSNIGNGQQSIYDRKGVLFFVTINQAFGLITTVCGTFPKERKIVLRERACNSYHISAYYLAKFFSELPFHLISPLVLGTIVYWMAHLRPEFARFMAFMGIITLESIAAVALGMAISSVSSSAEVATILANPISVVMLISGGFYISIQSLPAAAQWVADLSLMKWSFQALVVNEFEGTTLTCTEQDRHCLATGAEAIASIGFAGSTVWDGAAGLIVLTLALNFIAYTIMRYNKPRYQSLLAATTAFPTDGPETDLNTSKTR